MQTIKPKAGWKTLFQPNDRQLRRYCGEYYSPEWTHLKFIRHRGVNGSLTIQRTDVEALNTVLSHKKSLTEFKRVAIYVRGRKTSVDGKIQWLGNGAAVLTHDGFLVYECQEAISAENLTFPVHTVGAQNEKKVAEIISESLAITAAPVDTPTVQFPPVKAGDTYAPKAMNHVSTNPQPTVTTPVETKVIDADTIVVDGKVYKLATTLVAKTGIAKTNPAVDRAPVSKLDAERLNKMHKGLVLELRLPTRDPDKVLEQTNKVCEVLRNAMTHEHAGYGRALRETATIIFGVRVRHELVFERTICAKDGHKEYQRNGITYFGDLPVRQVYTATVKDCFHMLYSIQVHAKFARAIMTLSTQAQLDPTLSLDNIPARPEDTTKDRRELLRAVFGVDRDNAVHDVYTTMWKKLSALADARNSPATVQPTTETEADEMLEAVGEGAASAVDELAESVAKQLEGLEVEAPTTAPAAQTESAEAK